MTASHDDVGAPPSDRRRLLTLLGAGGAVAVATQLRANPASAGHDGTNTFHLGAANASPGGAATSLSADVGDAALAIDNADASETAAGVRASSRGPGPGVEGTSVAGPGIMGRHTSTDGGDDEDPEDPCNQPSTGTGVLGIGEAGVGVRGASDTGTGVEATSDEGLALRVLGRSGFATAGAGVVPAGGSSTFVTEPATGADAHVTVTLTSPPGSRQLHWVELAPGSGFTVHLTAAPPKQRPETTFTYLVVEPA